MPKGSSRPTCSIEGCGKPHASRGWCGTHYAHWLLHGDPVCFGTDPARHFECVWCGSSFERPHVAGRPPVACSDECRAEIAKARAKRWYRENPERLAIQPSKDPERRKAYVRAHYEANRERLIQVSLAYARGPGREVKRAIDARRYALRKGATPEGAEFFTLDDIFVRDGGWCYLCEKVVDRRSATMDHVIPVTKGGPHTLANVKLAHRGCNARKGNRLLAA